MHSTDACSLFYHDVNNLKGGRVCVLCKTLVDFAMADPQYSQDHDAIVKLNQPPNLNEQLEQAELQKICSICQRVVGAAHVCKVGLRISF